jgi:hypothetical protein
MDPVRLSAHLRSVADRIDRSERPSRAAVAAEVRRVLAAMGEKTISLDASGDIGYSDSNPVDEDEDGVGHEIEVALKAAGATSVEWTDEGVDISFPAGSEAGVRKAIDEIRNGSFGPDFGSYFSAMEEINEDGDMSPAAGPTKVVVSDSWTLEEVQALAPEFGGTDIRTGPYGDVGLVVPADKVDAVQEGGGEFHVFGSWEEASGDDPEYAFEPAG